MRLCLAPWESGFVVLTDGMNESLPARTYGLPERTAELRGWNVSFLLPDTTVAVRMEAPVSWTELDDPRLRFHSGTAVYDNRFAMPEVHSGERVYLRVSGLEAVSEVVVNGRRAGLIWCAPWEVEITDLLSDNSDNILSIRVANQLTNRMVGDLSLPEGERSTYATFPIVKEGDELLPAGITGSVCLVVR